MSNYQILPAISILTQSLDLLQRQGRVSYRALKRRFALDDDYLEDLKVEIIKAQRLAVDEDGEMLVWTGDASRSSTPPKEPVPTPHTYTPPYLAEKIRTSRSALQGERKQVTAMFADLKASMRGLSPFVRRQAELAVLHKALEQAGAGHGQVVSVIGEPRVGKTRLFHEFTHTSRTHGWLRLESSSASYGKATPYLPIIDLLKAYFQIEDRDDGRRMREKLTGRLLTLDPALGPNVAGLSGASGGAGGGGILAGPRGCGGPGPGHTEVSRQTLMYSGPPAAPRGGAASAACPVGRAL